jgi:hypothetical protein
VLLLVLKTLCLLIPKLLLALKKQELVKLLKSLMKMYLKVKKKLLVDPKKMRKKIMVHP